jgi:hypothetical protein
MIRSRGEKHREAPVSSLFLLCYLLLQKSSKFLISLSDCPVRRSIASLFFGKISLFPGNNRDFLSVALVSLRWTSRWCLEPRPLLRFGRVPDGAVPEPARVSSMTNEGRQYKKR